nr:unnamed protein product [Callosobruchus analis]
MVDKIIEKRTKHLKYGCAGALFLIAIKRGNRADFTDFFNKNGTGLTILRSNFSENRIRFLLRSLRFDNVNTRTQRSKTDKLAPIRDFLTNFISNSQSSYNIGECATIDEMLVAFRGRCSFIQYMAKKPAKYGLKIYAMCHSQTYYTYNLEIYCGIQEDGPHVCSNKPFDLVKRLVKPLEKSNRNITTDNYFSSIQLADYLLTVGLTFLGTLRKNKAEIPPRFVTENRNLVPGDYLFGCQDGKTLVSLVKLMQENLKERAKLRSILKDLSLFLESYREPTVHESPLQTQPNQRVICHMCGSKKNHRTQLACKVCRKYVCKHHCTVACNSCQENAEEDDDMD